MNLKEDWRINNGLFRFNRYGGRIWTICLEI